MTAPLTPASIRSRLAARQMGRRIECLSACDSTNDAAWEMALAGAPHGTAVFAEEQRRGRGRLGRTWTAPRGTSILCSVILRPTMDPERTPLVTAAAALAAAEAVEQAAGAQPNIRFPNDVFLGERKVAGVLVESRFISGRPDLFIAGIGINANQGRGDFPRELREQATSLAIETGAPVSRPHAARALLEALERWTEELEGSLRTLRRAWRERSGILGRSVRLEAGGRHYEGVVEDLDPAEGIQMRLPRGGVRLFRGEHIELLRVVP